MKKTIFYFLFIISPVFLSSAQMHVLVPDSHVTNSAMSKVAAIFRDGKTSELSKLKGYLKSPQFKNPCYYILAGLSDEQRKMLVKMLTDDSGRKLLYVKAASLIDNTIDMVAETIEKLFSRAKNCGTDVIICLDTIESISQTRSSFDREDFEYIRDYFLCQLASLQYAKNNICFIGLTHMPKKIDINILSRCDVISLQN